MHTSTQEAEDVGQYSIYFEPRTYSYNWPQTNTSKQILYMLILYVGYKAP